MINAGSLSRFVKVRGGRSCAVRKFGALGSRRAPLCSASVMRLLLLTVMILLTSACGSRAKDAPDPARVAKAQATIDALEKKFQELRVLPPQVRRERYLAMRPELEDAVVITTDLPPGFRDFSDGNLGNSITTSGPMMASNNFHAKALYFLANWRFLYANGEGVDELLDQLNRQFAQAFQRSGQMLRIQLRLRQGRMNEARAMAVELAQRMPEALGILDTVAWYEQVGLPAPRIADNNMSGGPAEPLSRADPWLLLVFTASHDVESQYYLNSLRAALARLPEARRPRLVQITFEGSPLQATHMVTPGEDLIWANPNANGTAARWQQEWRIPGPLPRNALVGADRRILAVEMQPERIADLMK